MTEHLRGRSAVVTGSSMGIGRAVAVELARQGAHVVLNGSTDARALDEAVDEARSAGDGCAVGVLGSVADFDLAGRLVATCADEFGAVDILVNAAGIPEPAGSSILTIDRDDWHRLVDVHLHGTFNTCRHAAPLMVERGRGSIVNTASHALLGIFGGTGYGAAKGATMSLTWQLALDLAEHGVRCNAVCPGARTRLSSGPDHEALIGGLHERGLLDDAMRDAALDPPPAEFLAPTYAFLASDLAAGITGKVFTAAGGYVGVWSGLEERFVAYRDHADGGRWDLDDLARELGRAGLA